MRRKRCGSLGTVPKILIILGTVLIVAYLFCLPRDLFKGTSYSTVVTDSAGELLGARIAADGQWRFPEGEAVPEKYATALIQFEDKYFRWHPGVNPVSLLRALWGNIRAGHITSGGSTLTMQVIRMSRRKERTLWQKGIEAILATRLELRCSKDEILGLYAAHAPFGGNVVGLEAAAWRYFGRPAGELSWGEAATLAVLPNAPASIHPGRARGELLAKRNRLLEGLLRHGKIDSLTYGLACEEPLPEAPHPLPRHAVHLVDHYHQTAPGVRTRTTVRLPLQEQVEEITDRWNREFTAIGAADLAAVVLDVRSGNILAWCGNANPDWQRPGSQVDIVRAPRSTGSILKPFLYCAMLQEGEILPHTLLPDIPVNMGGFSPQNFDRQFSGAVPASEALARSLNVPAVHMLRKYGVPTFHHLLRSCGLSTLKRSASDYGLSLILGGAEGTLQEITSAYASMAKTYLSGDSTAFPLHDRMALWYTFDALKEVNRPDEIDVHLITSVKKVAWKTGTSYGFRDAWAVGVTPDYAVGVWVGNAQGQGVPGLTGARTAGPVLFDLFNLLPARQDKEAYAENGWFLPPVYGEYLQAEVCPESGFLRGVFCDRADTLMLPRKAIRSETCPYHRHIRGRNVFLLPPAMEWYYRQQHPEYTPLTEMDAVLEQPMEFIYPESGSTIHIPRQLNGSLSGIVFQLAHRLPKTTVFWHLDDQYLGETKFIHQMTLLPPEGTHTVTVVDESGNTVSVRFEIRY